MAEAAAAAVVSALGVTGVAATVTYFATHIALAAASSAIISKLTTKPNSRGVADTNRVSTTIRQSAAPRRLIYGEVKTGGVLVYACQSSDSEYVDLAIYLGEGPIEGIDPVFWLGDERSDDAKFAGLLTATLYDGSPGQVASAALIAASGGEWTTDHIGAGCAWVHVRYKWSRNAFPQGLVLPTFLVKGRKLYDPRTETTAWSANPALIDLDFVRSEFAYDLPVPETWIDLDSYAAAAAICDEVVDSIDPANVVDSVPGKVRRYTCNLLVEANGNPVNVRREIAASMAGALVDDGALLRCYPGAYRTPTGPTLTEVFLRSAPTWRTHPGRQQRINNVRGTYREPRQDWQDVSYHEQIDAAGVAAEGSIIREISYPAVTNGATAQRLARIAMRTARSATPMTLPCNYSGMLWRLYDVVDIDLPQIGVSGPHLIIKMDVTVKDGIDLAVVPHLATDYAWDAEEDEVEVEDVVRPFFNTAPQPVTGLTVSGAPDYDYLDFAYPVLKATWTASADALRTGFEVQWRQHWSTDWTAGQTVTQTSWSVPGAAVIGTSYDVRVRSVRGDGTTSEWAQVDDTIVQADDEPPGPPTSMSVTGTGTHTIGWTNSGAPDLARARVYVNSANDAPTATLFATIPSIPEQSLTTTHTPGYTPAYYWVTCQDRTGNESARTYAGSGA